MIGKGESFAINEYIFAPVLPRVMNSCSVGDGE